MKWILLILSFTGPTSPDKIAYGGTFNSKEECEKAAPKYDSWVCIPLGDVVK